MNAILNEKSETDSCQYFCFGLSFSNSPLSSPDFDKMCTYKITYPNFQAFSKNNLCKWVTQRLFFVSLHHVCT